PESLLNRYRRFSLYNSPFPAHDRGRAIDVYPPSNVARSPVAGEVLQVETVGCPDRPYAVDHDHVIVVRVGEVPADARGLTARILHVDPAVEPGDRVAVGDRLGTTVRSGFFGPWVDNHIHLGFRPPDRDPLRASGSLPVVADVSVEPLEWDGTGTVAETGPSYALLDAPVHPDPGETFVAIGDDDARPLDGGLTHYEGGGTPGRPPGGGRRVHDRGRRASRRESDGTRPDGSTATVDLLGTRVGTVTGRHVRWSDVAVTANGERITGLSLFLARDAAFGAKLIVRDDRFDVGDPVSVDVGPTEDPIRLGPGR
ncbi:MAG: hypothetical protein V5A46_09725, partial [Haloferacaceae archaeon]